jgi:hypothetical protein
VLWNLIIVAPAAWAAARSPAHGLALCLAVYAASTLAWWGGKRACLAQVRRRAHAVA